ncbi:MAG: right-handed parallel beta-helix repeat-containing protein [Ferruginibacter sp.]
MKSIGVVILLLLGSCFAFCQVKTVYLTSFGAKPNDNISDQKAFNAASEYINKRKGNVKLVIPAGKYLVGPDYDYKLPVKKLPAGKLWDVIHLENCENVSFEGTGKVTIQFRDNIPFGCTLAYSDKPDSSVHIGSLFRLVSCKNITINNIKADGNNRKLRLLEYSGVGNSPYQREHEGLFILNCQNVTVKNTGFNYFGRDGFMVLQDNDKMPVKSLEFYNCTFNYNGRDGVSWCGGEDILFKNCEFNYNSRGRIQTNPGVGLDIEPERGANSSNGHFINCSFKDNGGYGIGSMDTAAVNILFDSCRIVGNTNYSLVINSKKVTINRSGIIGTALFLYDAGKEEDGFKIDSCTFTDTILGKKVFRDGYMLAIRGRYMRFNDCNFTSFAIPSLYTEIKKHKSLNDMENTIFKNCLFDARFKRASTWNNWGFIISHSLFDNCEFRSAGYVDFKTIFNQREKNVYLKNSRFTNKQ